MEVERDRWWEHQKIYSTSDFPVVRKALPYNFRRPLTKRGLRNKGAGPHSGSRSPFYQNRPLSTGTDRRRFQQTAPDDQTLSLYCLISADGRSQVIFILDQSVKTVMLHPKTNNGKIRAIQLI